MGKLGRSKGIVTVHDIAVNESGQPYLVLELCEDSLADELVASPLAPTAACRVGPRSPVLWSRPTGLVSSTATSSRPT